MTTFVVDNRETIKDVLKSRIPSVQYANLDLGDYRFDIDGEPVLIVERKTLADHAASITDGRHREQKARLLGTYGHTDTILLYLIEGDIMNAKRDLRYSRIKETVLVSSIFNTMFRDNIPVLRSGSQEETVFLLECLYEKLKKQGIPGKTASLKLVHDQSMLSGIKKCKKDNITPKLAFQMMLNCIPGVSNTISGRIVEHFTSMGHLTVALSKIDNNLRLEFLQTTLTGKRKVSTSVCNKIIELITF